MTRTVRLLVQVELDDDMNDTPEDVRAGIESDLGGVFGPEVTLIDVVEG